MKYPTPWAVIKCLVQRVRYMNRHDAYYEATASNLERSATAVVDASDETMRRLKRQGVRMQVQRKRIARANDGITKMLERTKSINDNSQIRQED